MNSSTSPVPAFRPTIFFSDDGRSVLRLPSESDETLSLLDSSENDFRFYRFSSGDEATITAAVTQPNTTFRFERRTLVLLREGRVHAAICPLPEPGAKAGDPAPALPDPASIQRLVRRHDEAWEN